MTSLIISLVSLIFAICGISLVSLYVSRKQALLKHIEKLIEHLRTKHSWDDKSELKLFTWMYESDESTLHYRNLLELRNILNNLISYWAVHESMEVNMPPEELVKNFGKEPEKMSFRFIIKELFFPDKPRLLI